MRRLLGILVLSAVLAFTVAGMAYAGAEPGPNSAVVVAWTLAGVALGALLGVGIVVSRVEAFGRFLARIIPGNTVEPALARLLRLLADAVEQAAKDG